MATNYFRAWGMELSYVFGFFLALALFICYDYDFSENIFFLCLISLLAVVLLVLWRVRFVAFIAEMKQHAAFLKLNFPHFLLKGGCGIGGMLKYRILIARLVTGFVAEKYTQYHATAFLACYKFNSVGAAHHAFLSTNSNQLVLSVGGIVVAPSFVVSKIFENSKLYGSVNYPLGASYSLAGDLFGVRYNFFSRYISGVLGGLYFSRGLYTLESGNV